MRRWHIAMIVSITLLILSSAWVRLQIVQISYEIHELEKQERDLQENIQVLSSKVEAFRTPQRLETLAKNKFHLQPANTKQVLILE
ncbi:MAG: hypothetical protein AB7F43_04555 [Bacteriovoracia bacterium]